MTTKLRLRKDDILVLRTCNADMTSHDGFRWPRQGRVVAKEWEDTDTCGHGLHGLPWGVDGPGYCSAKTDAVWLVVRVSTRKGGYRHGTGEMTDKCKFRSGTVVFAGKRDDATALIAQYAPLNTPINWLVCAGGYSATMTGGDYAKMTGGNSAKMTGGNSATMTGGNYATMTGGDRSYMRGGKGSIQVVWWYDGNESRCACRTVGADEANRWYYVERGVWTVCDAKTAARLDAETRNTKGTGR